MYVGGDHVELVLHAQLVETEVDPHLFSLENINFSYSITMPRPVLVS